MNKLYKMLTRDEMVLTERVAEAFAPTQEYQIATKKIIDAVKNDAGGEAWRERYEEMISELTSAIADNSYVAGWSDAIKMMMNLK